MIFPLTILVKQEALPANPRIIGPLVFGNNHKHDFEAFAHETLYSLAPKITNLQSFMVSIPNSRFILSSLNLQKLQKLSTMKNKHSLPLATKHEFIEYLNNHINVKAMRARVKDNDVIRFLLSEYSNLDPEDVVNGKNIEKFEYRGLPIYEPTFDKFLEATIHGQEPVLYPDKVENLYCGMPESFFIMDYFAWKNNKPYLGFTENDWKYLFQLFKNIEGECKVCVNSVEEDANFAIEVFIVLTLPGVEYFYSQFKPSEMAENKIYTQKDLEKLKVIFMDHIKLIPQEFSEEFIAKTWDSFESIMRHIKVGSPYEDCIHDQMSVFGIMELAK